MNYYQFNVGDYAAATAHLTVIEDCMYRRMLDRYYQTEGPLPVDETKLFRILRAVSKAEKEGVRSVLSEFFFVARDGHHHRRCDEEISIFRAKSDAARENGAKGGRQSKNLAKTVQALSGRKADAKLDGTQKKADGVAKQEPRNKNQEPEGKKEDISGQLSLTGDDSEAGKTEDPPPPPPPKKPKAPPSPERQALLAACGLTWAAYATAFEQQYGAVPQRAARENALIKQFVERVGQAEAPAIAAHYLRVEEPRYKSNMHPLTLLVSDSQKITVLSKTRKTSNEAARPVMAANGAPIIEAQERAFNAETDL